MNLVNAVVIVNYIYVVISVVIVIVTQYQNTQKVRIAFSFFSKCNNIK